MFRMGQSASKNQPGVGVPPFENYQGPPLGPPPPGPPGLVTSQYANSGGRVVSVDDGRPFWDNDQPVLPQPLPRPARGNFGPPPKGIPRRMPYGQSDSVVNQPGYVEQLRDGMMVEAARDAAWYRSPPPSQPPPAQPKFRTVRTYIDEPRGYVPPGQAQTQSYQVQQQPQAQAQQPANVMYYDPKTGALSSAAQHQAQPQVAYQPQQQVAYQQPQVAYQQPQVAYQQQPQVAYAAQPQIQAQPQILYHAAPQVMGTPQLFGYQQTAQPVMFQYPQQQQAQPIVVPGQLYTATGGVQQLG